MKTITERVRQLRLWMKDRKIEAMLVPTMDPHNSEYVAEHWQCRRWLTGFTGSAGTAVVTQDEALLWTDSRYWLQTAEQLGGTPFRLMKYLVDPTENEWLRAQAAHRSVFRVGYCPDMMVRELKEEVLAGLDAVPLVQDPFDELWLDRPAFPLSKAEIMPLELAGQSAREKLDRLTAWMRAEGKEELLVSELSEIMWLLNLRGDDIPYNPFLLSFLLVRTLGEPVYYIHQQQLTDSVLSYLAELGIRVASYQEAPRELEDETPISFWRAVKNEVEIRGFREAHVRDGLAMVKFLRRLDDWCADAQAEPLTEMGADRMLTALRAQQPGFRGLSFETIAGYGPHGAIVHYEPTQQTDVPLQRKGLLLLDSGAHYDCGTTDITRTLPLGPLTEEERTVYTLVLKGHLQLQHLQFPEGTVGLQLDTAARMAMWRMGYDFGHGTGHGVGHRLGVHEGPCQIRKNCRRDTTIPFQAGQNCTDEPGIYVEGKFGVRHENTLLCVAGPETPYGKFLRFEPLTLCPYDKRGIRTELLTPEELDWLNGYHQLVWQMLSLLLEDEADKMWLAKATSALKRG